MNTMKSFMSTLRRNPIYVGYFSKAEDVFDQFQEPVNPDIEFCYASYESECYDGDATIFFYKKSTKKYYEAYGSHCSCYGLEGQWKDNEEIVFEELENRLQNGHLSYSASGFKEAYDKYKKSVA